VELNFNFSITIIGAPPPATFPQDDAVPAENAPMLLRRIHAGFKGAASEMSVDWRRWLPPAKQLFVS
jgi:hypothetical protein